ncbi:MAG TPA: hypothetical protein VH280_15830 [Verrucomicrobiae bacterium]|nr:hypothetical protein [Verrucomicrobiae bacterium]
MKKNEPSYDLPPFIIKGLWSKRANQDTLGKLIMAKPEIEELGKLIIQHVRDSAIRNCNRHLRPEATDPVAKRWRELDGQGNLERIAKVLIPDIIDDALGELFNAIDQELLQLSFTASNGKTVDLPKDGFGELCGWYGGSWRELYSKEGVVDNFPGLEAKLLDKLRERDEGNRGKEGDKQ